MCIRVSLNSTKVSKLYVLVGFIIRLVSELVIKLVVAKDK